jgi:hypothetical protein
VTVAACFCSGRRCRPTAAGSGCGGLEARLQRRQRPAVERLQRLQRPTVAGVQLQRPDGRRWRGCNDPEARLQRPDGSSGVQEEAAARPGGGVQKEAAARPGGGGGVQEEAATRVSGSEKKN